MSETFLARHAFVTGGSKGIGEAVVRELLSRGNRVSFTYRNTEPPADLLSREDVLALPLDITTPGAIEDAITKAEESFGPLYSTVANAGATHDSLLLRMSQSDFESIVATNLTSAFALTKRAIASMVRARQGRIVLISSVVALMGSPGQVNYAASKAGLIGLARSLAREVASRDITVNVVAPGAIDTDILRTTSEARRGAIVEGIPAKRLGTPEEVASLVGYLCSPSASYITGAVITVDGGLSMGM